MTSSRELPIVTADAPLATGTISSAELGLPAGGSVTVRRLHGGRQEGVSVIVVAAGDLEVALLPTRGMGVWWARHRGRDLFWKSPVREAVHPNCVNLDRNGGLGWLDGFCEGIVRCGLGFNGAPGVDEIIDDTGKPATVMLPLHGRIANLPASTVTVAGRVEAGCALISVTGTVLDEVAQYEKYRLQSCTEVALGGNRIRIHDEVTNLSAERAAPLELLYHINFGPPALADGTRMDFRGTTTARDERAAAGLREHNRFHGSVPGFTEQCYFIDLDAAADGTTGAMLTAPDAGFAVFELHNKRQLKCFTQWKQLGADEYVNGFEPGTSLPNSRGDERRAGRLEFLRPGEAREFDVTVGALDNAADIRRMQKRLGPAAAKGRH